MTLWTAIILTITLAAIVIMVPKSYISWSKAERLMREGDTEGLESLLAMQNSWIKRHLICGISGLAIVWIMMNYQKESITNILTDSLAFCVTVALVLAIVESVLAQKIADHLATIPVTARFRAQK